jgi:two-component system phosphate regulon sensor histidine kinase PhoR
VRLAARTLPDGAAEISVADTGVGIAPEHLPKVFERFFQVDKTQADPAKGAGLGLAIVQSIMRLHGGTAHVASVVGAGTTITLTFPVRSVAERAPGGGELRLIPSLTLAATVRAVRATRRGASRPPAKAEKTRGEETR